MLSGSYQLTYCVIKLGGYQCGYPSIGIITQPFLGPNFCYVDRILEISLSLRDINVAICSGRFSKLTKTLIDFVYEDARFQSLPVVVLAAHHPGPVKLQVPPQELPAGMVPQVAQQGAALSQAEGGSLPG